MWIFAEHPRSLWKILGTPDLGQETETKVVWNVTRSSGLAKTILQGTVQGKEEKVGRRRGGKIILKGEQGWTLLAQQEMLQYVTNDPEGPL